MCSQRNLKNHFFHTRYLTTNEPLDEIVLCYSFNHLRVSIQLLAAMQINQLIDWLIGWTSNVTSVSVCSVLELTANLYYITAGLRHGAEPQGDIEKLTFDCLIDAKYW